MIFSASATGKFIHYNFAGRTLLLNFAVALAPWPTRVPTRVDFSLLSGSNEAPGGFYLPEGVIPCIRPTNQFLGPAAVGASGESFQQTLAVCIYGLFVVQPFYSYTPLVSSSSLEWQPPGYAQPMGSAGCLYRDNTASQDMVPTGESSYLNNYFTKL